MMTRRDPYVNMLRTTIAAFSAGIGGADAVTVLPFTAALGLPDRFARRIARNTQLLLLEESNLAKVADPAAGSGGIEDLTEKLCRAAWALFQEIEQRRRRAAPRCEHGLIQEQGRGGARRARGRRRPSQGRAHRHQRLSRSRGSAGRGARRQARARFRLPPPPSRYPPLAASRASPNRSSACATPPTACWRATGARPKIFLANLGTLAEFTARATFAKNFFEAGGIEAVSNDGFDSRDDMIAAFKASGAKLACLCSSDAVYEREAAEAAKALAAAGATHIYLAGRPKQPDALKAAGVGTFIFAGCDVLATLRAAHGILELKS